MGSSFSLKATKQISMACSTVNVPARRRSAGPGAAMPTRTAPGAPRPRPLDVVVPVASARLISWSSTMRRSLCSKGEQRAGGAFAWVEENPTALPRKTEASWSAMVVTASARCRTYSSHRRNCLSMVPEIQSWVLLHRSRQARRRLRPGNTTRCLARSPQARGRRATPAAPARVLPNSLPWLPRRRDMAI